MSLKKSNKELKCKYFRVQEDVIKKVENNLPNDREFGSLIELFKVFTDEIKIKIIYILFDSEVCICELGELLKINEDEVIRNLNKLVELRIVKYRQINDMVCYSLSNNHIHHILVEGFIHKSYID